MPGVRRQGLPHRGLTPDRVRSIEPPPATAGALACPGGRGAGGPGGRGAGGRGPCGRSACGSCGSRLRSHRSIRGYGWHTAPIAPRDPHGAARLTLNGHASPGRDRPLGRPKPGSVRWERNRPAQQERRPRGLTPGPRLHRQPVKGRPARSQIAPGPELATPSHPSSEHSTSYDGHPRVRGAHRCAPPGPLRTSH
jgi:hypothetical protein